MTPRTTPCSRLCRRSLRATVSTGPGHPAAAFPMLLAPPAGFEPATHGLGMVFWGVVGHVGLVQGLIVRLRKEIPGITEQTEVKIIAHGGLAPLMAPIIPEIQYVNQYLPLEGLRLAYTRLRGEGNSNKIA